MHWLPPTFLCVLCWPCAPTATVGAACGAASESFTTLIWLGLEGTGNVSEFRASMQAMQAYMEGADKADIQNEDPWEIYHCSINYFCCYSAAQRATVKQILHTLPWEPFNLTFSHAMCNMVRAVCLGGGGVLARTRAHVQGPGEDYLSIEVLADNASQAILWSLAGRIQEAVVAAGLPDSHPRVQPFHSTLAQVMPAYPVDAVMAHLNSTGVLNPTTPITVSWYATQLAFTRQ
jgi:hypothetical protein